MAGLYNSILLFFLNALDAQLTIIWVRNDIATEGNGLMARLLNLGDVPFLTVKLAVGAFAALVLYRFAHVPLAKRGGKFALAIYSLLMVVHALTGMSALGWAAPEHLMAMIANLPVVALSLFS